MKRSLRKDLFLSPSCPLSLSLSLSIYLSLSLSFLSHTHTTSLSLFISPSPLLSPSLSLSLTHWQFLSYAHLQLIQWSINWDHRMALGSCNYDVNGLFGGCNLGSSKSCFTSVGDVCTAATTLVTMCPLQYGGTGQGCQPPNLITTLINIALKPGQLFEDLQIFYSYSIFL